MTTYLNLLLQILESKHLILLIINVVVNVQPDIYRKFGGRPHKTELEVL